MCFHLHLKIFHNRSTSFCFWSYIIKKKNLWCIFTWNCLHILIKKKHGKTLIHFWHCYLSIHDQSSLGFTQIGLCFTRISLRRWHTVKFWWLIKWMGTLSLCLLNYALYKTVLKTTDPEHEILKAISLKSFPRGGASFLILFCCIFVKWIKLLLPLSFGFSSTFLSNAWWTHSS